MAKLIKMECTCCGGRYYDDKTIVPEGAQEGEAFPSDCPLCEDGRYAVLPKSDKGNKKAR